MQYTSGPWAVKGRWLKYVQGMPYQGTSKLTRKGHSQVLPLHIRPEKQLPRDTDEDTLPVNPASIPECKARKTMATVPSYHPNPCASEGSPLPTTLTAFSPGLVAQCLSTPPHTRADQRPSPLRLGLLL